VGLPFQPSLSCTEDLPSQAPRDRTGSCSEGLPSQSPRHRAGPCTEGHPSQLPRSCTEGLPSQSPRHWASSCARSLRSANGDKVDAVCWTRTGQYCTLRSGSNSNPGTPGSPRAFRSLCAARSRRPASSRRICPAGYLRYPGAVEAAKIQARQWRDQALSRLPEPAPTQPSIWKRFRIFYRKPMPKGLRAKHRTHRIRLAAFEEPCGLVEPIGRSGLPSGN